MNAISPSARAADITERIQRAFDSEKPRYSVLSLSPFAKKWNVTYLPSDNELVPDLNGTGPDEFLAEPFDPDSPPHFIIVPCSASPEEAANLWDLRRQVGSDPVIVVWLWDNHLVPLGNLRCAYPADLVFHSHQHANEGWFNVALPFALSAGHVPACSAQWTYDQAVEYFGQACSRPRLHKHLINYVLYSGIAEHRKRILLDYQRSLRNADVFLMRPADRSRYMEMDRRARFAEWSSYKATIVVPVEADLSTRVFDALLAGLVMIVPDSIPDFDLVIPSAIQTSLGIIRVGSLELDDIQEASQRALDMFDSAGTEGVAARHAYALENHMLVNRIASMLATFWLIGKGQQNIVFRQGPKGPALYLESAGG